jgi:hypothetical protein
MTTAKAFRYETDLAAPVERFLRKRLGGDWDIAHELRLPHAGPDLVAGRRTRAFAERAAAGPPPVTSELQIRLTEFLADEATERELRRWAPWGWRDLRRRALEPALAAGLLTFDGERWLGRQLPAPYDRLVAVELKLRDWRKGLRQARRYQAFALQSWLALDRVDDGAIRLGRELGVGIIEVAGEAVAVIEPKDRNPLARLETRVISEQILEQALEQLAPGSEKLRALAGSPRGRKLAVPGRRLLDPAAHRL